MNRIAFQISSNEEILQLVDSNVPIFFLDRVDPQEKIEWWKTNLLFPSGKSVENIEVRNMTFSVQTDLNGLKTLLDENIEQVDIYQFDKRIPNTLPVDELLLYEKWDILRNAGLKHIFCIRFEVLTIQSFDDDFLNNISSSEKYKERIENWKNLLNR